MDAERPAAGEHWERHADEWIGWARTPRHDAFWWFRDEFRAFLPPPGRATLDLGCGEGRISRELTGLGHTVTATDVAPSLLAAAREADSATRYALADAVALPFDDGEFDRVVTYNVLMDVPDPAAVLAEAARVLSPDGALTASIVHPNADRGAFDGPDPEAPFVLQSDYFDGGYFTGSESRDGLSMHYEGWRRTLGEYVTAAGDAGLGITALREPRPATGAPEPIARWRRAPLFLWFTARPIQHP